MWSPAPTDESLVPLRPSASKLFLITMHGPGPYISSLKGYV